MQKGFSNRDLTLFPKMVGFSLIGMAILSGVAYGFAFNKLYTELESLDTKYTKLLLRVSITSFVLIVLLDILVAWGLYHLFEKKNRAFTLLMAWFRLFYAGLLALAILNLSTYILTPLEKIHLDEFEMQWSVGLILFGCHLILLGYLLFKSDRVPKYVSIPTLFAGCCYFLRNIALLIVPNYQFYQSILDQILALPMALGELILTGGLIRSKGVQTL